MIVDGFAFSFFFGLLGHSFPAAPPKVSPASRGKEAGKVVDKISKTANCQVQPMWRTFVHRKVITCTIAHVI